MELVYSKPTAAAPSCEPEHPDRCTADVVEGTPAPLTGLVLSYPLARSLKDNLDRCTATVAEEKRYCDVSLDLARTAEAKRLAVQESEAQSREALLKAALATEQGKEKKMAEENGQQETERWLFAAGGVGAGVLVGLIAGAVLVVVYVPTR